VIRSLVFTTAGKLHSRNVDMLLMPTLLADTNLFLWVDMEKPTREENKFILEQVFHFHPLSIEDCVMETRLPKVEEYTPGDNDLFSPYLFIVIHGVDYDRAGHSFGTTELDFFLGRNFLVTHHEVALRSVAQTEEQAIKGTMRVARAPDRIAHTLLDAVVDNYKPALDELSDEIADLEQQALQHSDPEILNKIIQIKKEAHHLRRIIAPQRDVIARFARGEFKLVRPHLLPYYRDVHDHLVQITDQAQAYTDSLTAILQVYLSMSSNRTGEVVKLLTLITLLTTPLMMVATWYGMNFKNMPELDWKHGYALAAGVTALSTAATYTWFKKKRWW
jgi:magnesium transporter